jgi:integrase
MSRRRSIPTYRLHKQSGQAIVTLTNDAGQRRDVLLGEYDSTESRTEYLRVVNEWETRGRRLPDRDAAAGIRVNEVLEAFLNHAAQHYRRPDGTVTAELNGFKLSIRPVRQLYGLRPATAFGPLALKAVRDKMVADGLCRAVTNQRCRRIVRIFKWAVSQELVPEPAWRALTSLKGLQRGRTPARETEPVRAVSDVAVGATLPHLLPTVAAMVRLQRLTGMRPGELFRMRACDIDLTGDVWLYRPPEHKNSYRGLSRVVALGPQAQAIVREFLTLDTQAFLFSPRHAMEARRVARREQRVSKVQPSQHDRRKRNPKNPPREVYSNVSYARAVARACDCAFPPRPPLARTDDETVREWTSRLTDEQRAELRAWRKDHRWNPNRLRHAHATEVRKKYGLEAAQTTLGHSRADVSQIYAERDMTLAARVAREIG